VPLQYLDGPEVDVDLVFDQGMAVYGAVTVSECGTLPAGPLCIKQAGLPELSRRRNYVQLSQALLLVCRLTF
jgi:hypothetical protein